MLRTVSVAACMAICAIASPAAASDSGPGLVSNVMPMRNGVVIFQHSGSRTATPGCHGAGHGWTLNAGTVAGQAQLAVLLSAQAQGKKIVIVGWANCNDWADTEAANYFRVDD